jgi:hypothetical protein
MGRPSVIRKARHQRQRGDERRNLEPRAHQAREAPEAEPGGDRHPHDQRRRYCRRDSHRQQCAQQPRRQAGAEGHRRPDAQVNLARDNHHRHAEGDDALHRDIAQNVEQVFRLAESRRRQGQDDAQRQQNQFHSGGGKPPDSSLHSFNPPDTGQKAD